MNSINVNNGQLLPHDCWYKMQLLFPQIQLVKYSEHMRYISITLRWWINMSNALQSRPAPSLAPPNCCNICSCFAFINPFVISTYSYFLIYSSTYFCIPILIILKFTNVINTIVTVCHAFKTKQQILFGRNLLKY